jgi:enoyl-CoA hydratase/carnithine racemase
MDFNKYKKFKFSLEGKVLTLSFNDPDRLNPLDAEVERELGDFLHEGWRTRPCSPPIRPSAQSSA